MDIDEKIFLSEYDVNWETQFQNEKTILQKSFPDVYIEHVGSTAVKGMLAKPIIDILIGVQMYPPRGVTSRPNGAVPSAPRMKY